MSELRDNQDLSRAQKKAVKKAETENVYQKVMSDYSEMAPASPEKPQSAGKVLKRIGVILFILLNAAVIYVTAANEFSKEAPPITFSFSNILFLLGGVLCLALYFVCETAKYMMMMRHLGEKVSLRHAFSTAALGKYYDCITPSGVGGQPFQIYNLHSNGYSDGASSAMPLSGFFTMQFGFVFLCLITFLFGNGAIDATGYTGIRITAYFGAIAYMLVPLMIIIFGIAPKIAMRIVAFFVRIAAILHLIKKPNHAIMKSVRTLNNYSVNIKRITNDKVLLLKLMLLSVLLQVAMCSMPFFAVRTFDGDLRYFDALFMCVFIQAAIALIPTPGNAGAAEGSFYIVFSSLGTEGTFWAMLIWRFLCYYSFIIVGVLIYGYNAVVRLLKKRRGETVSEETR